MYVSVFLTLFVLAAHLTGCTSSSKSANVCESFDWFEHGRRHGSAGVKAEELRHPAPECADTNVDTLAYEMGRQNGLTQYCEPKNALSLGRMGVPSNDVCPPAMRSLFNENYAKGKRILELEKINDSINDEMSQLYRALGDPRISPQKRNNVSNTLRVLEDQRARNNAQINTIEQLIF